MADLHSTFQEFHQNIRILSGKKNQMKASKDALRERIRKYFKEHHPELKPIFFIQGSQKMKNGIRYKDDTADLDDGVYFEGTPNVSPTTLQQWVYDAIKGHTEGGQEHRKKCIRVIFKGDYNIDLPVFYFTEQDPHPFLAVKNEGWKEDDPKELVEWFKNIQDKDGQMLRETKFTKAWCDFKSHDMPPGLCMTILVAQNISYHKRDDVCLKETLASIRTFLTIQWNCFMPTTPKEDLFAKYDDIFKKNFLKSLDEFIKDAAEAIDTTDRKKASNLWRKHLGDRFPECENEEANNNGNSKAALGAIASQSKPYAE